MIIELTFKSEFFDPKDTLDCGQIFRYFKLEEDKYLVLSADKGCVLQRLDDEVRIFCESEDEQYFFNYFDLKTDYSAIYAKALESGYSVLQKAAAMGKGVRILRQDPAEMLFSFMVSQNNNIPRIKGILNKICTALGERKSIMGYGFNVFPSPEALYSQPEQFYRDVGMGYRANYVLPLKQAIDGGLIDELTGLNSEQVKKRLIAVKGIGEKVADCICLFGLYKTDSFPVDVWIEKIYREDFNGELSSRSKISSFFVNRFKDYSGYFQQYLFYYKRSLENK